MFLMVPYLCAQWAHIFHGLPISFQYAVRAIRARAHALILLFLRFEDNIYVTGLFFWVHLSAYTRICRMFHLNFYYLKVFFLSSSSFYPFVFVHRVSSWILDLVVYARCLSLCVRELNSKSGYHFHFFRVCVSVSLL